MLSGSAFEIRFESLDSLKSIDSKKETATYKASFGKKLVVVKMVNRKSDTEINHLFGLKHPHLVELL